MKTESPNGLPMSDRSDLKYVDIGSMRYQWGHGGGVGGTVATFTFAVPFKDTNFSFVAMFNGGTASNQYTMCQTGRTTSSCTVEKKFSGGGASGEQLDWIAIGLKP